MTEVDRTAFEDLYRDHYWSLLRFAVRRTPDQERARDVVAETFTIAWRRRGTLPPGRALPWLYKVAGNVIANDRRRDEHAAEAYRTLGGYSMTAHQTDLAEQAEWSSVLDEVLQALHTLSEPDRQVLMLHAWEGLNGKDLGTALDCSAATASVRLHRARRRLDSALTARGSRTARRPVLPALRSVQGDER
ncbi:sigma-70 family RNA polymerase sigma factor [Streptomyces sp. SID13031]|uniref:RNA polymerase sigma factor n=1 Tax=Streptomyces sp. SID13031 TaxID=2706046 RepID=UPI0013C87DFB|nr:sigma-70 family RNA polymerase sigma factor [Streptomyces sp. SID13031]NEA33831.1 sigma-70 family RNA polymerase sigma factor [Streptomyces sp. SID13031]